MKENKRVNYVLKYWSHEQLAKEYVKYETIIEDIKRCLEYPPMNYNHAVCIIEAITKAVFELGDYQHKMKLSSIYGKFGNIPPEVNIIIKEKGYGKTYATLEKAIHNINSALGILSLYNDNESNYYVPVDNVIEELKRGLYE